MKTNLKNQAGFTLLFASLAVSTLLAIGLSISNVTLSQYVLSSAGRESQFAFYNADTGVECGLYYENNVLNVDGGPYFPIDFDDPVGVVRCGNDATGNPIVAVGNIVSDEFDATTTTLYEINPPSDCDTTRPSFTIQVEKGPGPSLFSSNVIVSSRGYNTCDPANPRRVERGLYSKFIN